MTYRVKAAEVIYDDVNQNSHKFWRYYVIGPDHWVAHWGRIGAEGQFKLFRGSEWDAESKLNEKLSKGYEHGSHAEFTVQDIEADRWRQNAALRTLGQHFGSGGTAANAGKTKAQQEAEEDAYAEETLRQTLLRMAGTLTDEPSTPVDEQNGTSQATSLDPDSMEARLTAALAKAEAK